MAIPKLSIIIVNWNAGEQLLNCLRSVQSSKTEGFELEKIVVVDNHSQDSSLAGLEELKLPLLILRNSQNLGFGKACNQGARATGNPDYLLFLNPDAVLYSDALSQTLQFMEEPQNSRYGICGIQLLDEAGAIARSCARFPGPAMFLAEMCGLSHLAPQLFPSHHLRSWAHDDSREVDHVIGAYFLVRSKVFSALEGFDERFFVYLEDLDFSFRAFKSGWRSFYLAEVQSFHKGGGTSEQVKATRLYYSIASRLKYAHKHFGSAWGLTLTFATFTLELPARLCLSLLKDSVGTAQETLKAYELLAKSLMDKDPVK